MEPNKEPISGLNGEAAAALQRQLERESQDFAAKAARLDNLRKKLNEDLGDLFAAVCQVHRPGSTKALEEMLMVAPEGEEE